MEQMHESVRQLVTSMKDTFFSISDTIFNNPELSDEEFESSKYLAGVLRDNGFEVQFPYAGVETAFRADFVTGDGPTIGFLAEYDALPGYGPNSLPAHACGHNWIAATAVGAGLALAKVPDKFKGRIVVFGTPGEEAVGRKADMANFGAFDDVDAAFQLHLGKINNLKATALAMDSVEFEFFGKAAHAAAFPEDGINALDAVILTFNGINFLRQQLPSDVRIHGIVTEGGTAPNIIPDHCKALFYVRAARKATFLAAFEKVKECGKGAATMTGCELKINMHENQFDDLLVNPTLAGLMEKHMLASGFGPMTEVAPNPGSTDVGNVSYRCPTFFGEAGIADGKVGLHEEDFLPIANGEEARRLILESIESFICTAIELGEHPELVKEARAQYEKQVL